MAVRLAPARPGRVLRPEPTPEERRHLRVVPTDYVSARARRRRARRLVVLGGIGVAGALFGVVAFHVVLTQSQLNLQHLRTQAETATVRQQQLRLQAAQLESPERVVHDAQRLGMVPPASVRYLSPSPAGTPAPAPAPRTTPTTAPPRTAAPARATSQSKTPATTTPAKSAAKPVTTTPAKPAPSPTTTAPARPAR